MDEQQLEVAVRRAVAMLLERMLALVADPADLSVPLSAGTLPALLLSRTQLAARLGVQPAAVYRWGKGGMPVAEYVGRSPRYDLVQCRAWLNQRRDRATGDAPSSRERPIPGVHRVSRRPRAH